MPRYCLALTLALLASSPAAAQGYLEPGELPALQVWLAPAPTRGSVREAADLDEYLAARAELDTPRGSEAIADNVYDPADVILRFNEALGFQLDQGNAPRLIALMDRVMRDEEAMLHPVKRPVREGGRLRPYVRFQSLQACPHERDDRLWDLSASGAYPSGHAMLGWTWALLLSEAAPTRSSELLQRGHAFGRSRLICGFHWPSDIEAGRDAASALVARLHADPAFEKDWRSAKREIASAARKRGTP